MISNPNVNELRDFHRVSLHQKWLGPNNVRITFHERLWQV